MSGLDKDRKRNQTVCFRMTPEERRELEARITVSGLPKGKYFIQSVLYQEVKIAVGKYQSDRLSLEIRRLWERLEHLETEDLYEVLADCRALMQQVIEITGNDCPVTWKAKDIVLGKNLFILGTMNTADKSIDAIDYAIRRRFIFIDSPANRDIVMKCYQNVSGNTDENSIELLLFDAVQRIFDDSRFFNNEYQKSDVRIGHTYFLRDRKRGYEDAIIEHFIFQVIPILREYVKDGILDVTENLVPLEHVVSEIHSAGSGEEQIELLSENIMLYVKEFGNLTKSNATIDNEYIGKFLDDLRKEFGY